MRAAVDQHITHWSGLRNQQETENYLDAPVISKLLISGVCDRFREGVTGCSEVIDKQQNQGVCVTGSRYSVSRGRPLLGRPPSSRDQSSTRHRP